MQNKYSDYFVCARSLILGFYCHFHTSKYKHRSSEKDCQIKKKRMINWGGCTTETSVLKTIECKGPSGHERKPKP